MKNLMTDVTAIVLCGGKGERLRPHTEHVPKPLLCIKGKPLLLHLLDYLSSYGISRFVLCVGYRAEMVEQFADGCGDPRWRIDCVNSGDASMAQRVLDARRHVHGRAIICYGDTLANVNLEVLEREHAARSALASIAVYPFRSPFGIVRFDASHRVTELAEKPLLPYWINIGYLLCEPAALDRLAPPSDLVQFSASLAETGRLYVHEHNGKHITVNTVQELRQAEDDVAEFLTVAEYHQW
jgi:NDP-sugar pyrophosphorylase family protein